MPLPDIVIAGSIAYDQLAQTSMPLTGSGDKLNCKLDTLSLHHGGCGANLAYNLHLLGLCARVLGVAGQADAEPLVQALRNTANCEGLLHLPGQSSRAIIITDPDGAQFTAFYPGPQPNEAQWREHVSTQLRATPAVFVQAPQPIGLMVAALEVARAYNVPGLIWCPGQYADQMQSSEVTACLRALRPGHDMLVGNAYEIESLAACADLTSFAHVVTRGAGAVTGHRPGAAPLAVAVPPSEVVDPTGCGDAFLAAFVGQTLGSRGLDLERMESGIQQGITLAQACLRQTGCQQHHLPH